MRCVCGRRVNGRGPSCWDCLRRSGARCRSCGLAADPATPSWCGPCRDYRRRCSRQYEGARLVRSEGWLAERAARLAGYEARAAAGLPLFAGEAPS